MKQSQNRGQHKEDRSLIILRERVVKGEMTEEEYVKKRKMLEDK